MMWFADDIIFIPRYRDRWSQSHTSNHRSLKALENAGILLTDLSPEAGNGLEE
jgi:hypothetical protein